MSRRGREAARGDVYTRLADDLRHAITSGRYKPGDRLPSTVELMDRENVANLTARAAYRQLIEEGLVEAVPKRGYFVREHARITWHLSPAGDWAADAIAAGRSHRAETAIGITDASVTVLGRTLADRLAIAPDARMLSRRTTRYTGPPDGAATEPDSVSVAYYPYDLADGTPLAAPGDADPARVLADLGTPIAGHDDELYPRLATGTDRQMLELGAVSVVLELART